MGTEIVAAEHRQCLKATACLPPAAATSPIVTAGNSPGADSGTQAGSITAAGAAGGDSLADMDKAAQPAAVRSVDIAAPASAAAMPPQAAATKHRRMDFLTVCMASPELAQHPAIAAEEVGATSAGPAISVMHVGRNQFAGGGQANVACRAMTHVSSYMLTGDAFHRARTLRFSVLNDTRVHVYRWRLGSSWVAS